MTQQTSKNANDLMSQGVTARENHEFEKSHDLLNKAKDTFEKEKDYFNVTECLNHIAYTHKLTAQHSLQEATKTLESALKISKNKKTKPASILRAQMSILSAANNYEEALKVAKKLLKLYDKPANQGDVLGHMAEFYLRTGAKQKALLAVDKALALIEKGWKNEVDPARSIWKCKALITKAQILLNKGQCQFAKKAAEEAFKLATEKNLKSRAEQAATVLKTLD